MKLLFTSILLFFRVASGQEIFNSFGLDGEAQYLGETIYQFETDINALLILSAHNIKGDIEIHGEPGNTVQIVERIEISSTKTRWAKKEYELSRAKISYDGANSLVKILGPGRWSAKAEYEYDIHIPKHTSVQIINQGGDISARNIIGEINIQTAGGDIELQKITGKIYANTSGGDVEVNHSTGNFKLLSSGGDIETNNTEGILVIETKGGDLDIRYNRGNVEAKTYGGEIYFSGVEGNMINAITMGGDITAEEVTADMDLQTSGGDFNMSQIIGNITAETSAGDIYIDHVIGDVVLETLTGSVHGEYLGGRINAITNTGDIVIRKITNEDDKGQDIDLVNNFGDVYLILPEHFSATFDIRIDGVKDSDALDSEFPVNISQKGMSLRASGVHGTGQHKVKISSHFGKVTISKD